MSISIESAKCTGCGKCIVICPGNLIQRNEEGKAHLSYPKDCWGCAACLKECSFCAIKYRLGADIGGKGAYLTAIDEKDTLKWHIVKGDSTETITINKKESNKY